MSDSNSLNSSSDGSQKDSSLFLQISHSIQDIMSPLSAEGNQNYYFPSLKNHYDSPSFQRLEQLYSQLMKGSIFSNWDAVEKVLREYEKVARVPLKKKKDKRKEIGLLMYCCCGNNKPPEEKKQYKRNRKKEFFAKGCKFKITFEEKKDRDAQDTFIQVTSSFLNHSHLPLDSNFISHKMAVKFSPEIKKAAYEECLRAYDQNSNKFTKTIKQIIQILSHKFPDHDWTMTPNKKVQNIKQKIRKQAKLNIIPPFTHSEAKSSSSEVIGKQIPIKLIIPLNLYYPTLYDCFDANSISQLNVFYQVLFPHQIFFNNWNIIHQLIGKFQEVSRITLNKLCSMNQEIYSCNCSLSSSGSFGKKKTPDDNHSCCNFFICFEEKTYSCEDLNCENGSSPTSEKKVLEKTVIEIIRCNLFHSHFPLEKSKIEEKKRMKFSQQIQIGVYSECLKFFDKERGKFFKTPRDIFKHLEDVFPSHNWQDTPMKKIHNTMQKIKKEHKAFQSTEFTIEESPSPKKRKKTEKKKEPIKHFEIYKVPRNSESPVTQTVNTSQESQLEKEVASSTNFSNHTDKILAY